MFPLCRSTIIALALLIGVFLLWQAVMATTTLQQVATAVIAPTAASGSNVTGNAVFTQDGDDIMLTVDVENAPPGLHAVHIHATGDCSAPDGTSAGGHWNPTDQDHGKWGSDSFHLGDLGNIPVGDDGTGSLELTTDLWELGTGSELDILGKAIIGS